jgi:CHAT domain-containing protein
MPQALKEMRVVQAVNGHVATLFSVKATPTAVLKRLWVRPFVRFVCHEMFEPGKPLEASFKHHEGKHLRLLDIVRFQLFDAEFAFLLACHTAALTDENIEDELLHLSAAMQSCGFRSVVGTMWAMADVGGPELARHFYESVFSDETQSEGARYNERMAEVLRDAVKTLWRKGKITLERWVNFVYYGA